MHYIFNLINKKGMGTKITGNENIDILMGMFDNYYNEQKERAEKLKVLAEEFRVNAKKEKEEFEQRLASMIEGNNPK